MQHTATHCNTLQHTATHCLLQQIPQWQGLMTIHCNTLKHTAPHCTTLHHTAPHCTTHCTTLPRTADPEVVKPDDDIPIRPGTEGHLLKMLVLRI